MSSHRKSEKKIGYIPFRWSLSNEEVNELSSKKFFDIDCPGVKPSELSGYEHWEEAGKAISRLTDATDKNPENIILLHSLAHSIIEAIEHAWSPDSLRFLVKTADFVVEKVNEYPAELLRPIAAARVTWPQQLRLKDLEKKKRKVQQSSLRNHLENLELGSRLPLKVLGDGDSNRIARLMIATIEENQQMLKKLPQSIADKVKETENISLLGIPDWVVKCRTLDPLTSASAMKWFAIGWDALMEATKGKPELISEFRMLGEYKARKSETGSIGTTNANIRDGIRWQLQQAFKRLAHEVTQPGGDDDALTSPP